MPVKADYKRAKKVSVLEGLEEMRAEAAKKAAAEAALPKFKKFDPQYAEASLVPELRATRPPKEGGGDEAPAWMSQALNAKRKRRRRGSKARGPDALPADYAAPPPGGAAAAAGGDDASLAGGASGPRGPDLAAGLRPVEPGAHLELAERKAVGNKDWGPSVFERDSPRARATLRTFLCDFLVDDARGNVRVRKDIDLRAYAREAMREVTNATVQEICVMQPAMTSLDVTDCHLVTDAALWAVSRHCKELRTLVASGCGQITRVGLRAMTLGCPLVQRLELSRCASLDDPALSAIAAGFPHLVSLTVSECDHITDDGLAVLASGCRDLEHVDVSGCPRLGEFGDRALLALGRFCGRLERLDMFGCAHVPVWKSTGGMDASSKTSNLSISVTSKSIRLMFGRIDCP
jgi:F-box/leucine-rich repeat protein 2/20